MGPKLKLTHAPITRSVRVHWLLTELDLPFEVTEVNFSDKPSYQSEGYKQKNPLASLPTLEDGDVVITESIAVILWLLEKYGEGRLQPAPGTPEKAAFLQWLVWGEATLASPTILLIDHTFMFPEEQKVESERVRLRAGIATRLAILENALAGKQYIVGDQFTAADIVLTHSLNLLVNILKLAPEAEFPNINAYFKLHSVRPGYIKAQAKKA